MDARKTVIAEITLMAVCTLAQPARAACNSLPNASEVTDQGTQFMIYAASGSAPDSGSATPAPQLMRYRYKAAFGRIDGVHYVEGPLRIAADGTCVTRGMKVLDEAPVIRSVGPAHDLAVFVIFHAKPGHPVPVWAYSAAAQPAATMPFSVASLRDSLQHALGGSPSAARLLPKQWDANADPIPLAAGVTGLRVALPPLAPGSAAPEYADLSLESSAVRIVAMHLGRRGPDSIAVELAHLIRGDCASRCETFAAAGGVACIDTLFTRVHTAAATLEYAEDPFLCTVEIPKDEEGRDIQFNDYQAECETAPPDARAVVISRPLLATKAGIPAAATPAGEESSATDAASTSAAVSSAGATAASALLRAPAQCGDAPTHLRFWRSECGAIHIPLDYSNIRREQLDDGQVVEINRVLSGRSGVGRAKDTDKRRIFVPGREFVGSTPPQDAGDTDPDTRWRFPEIDTWYPAGDNAAELGLTGLADKDRSIVHVFPRRPAFRVCTDASGGQGGCMGVTSAGIFCARDIPKIPEIPCEDTDENGKYFACVGGGRDNMPCTRDLHCKKKDDTEDGDGTCTRQPICRPNGAIWRYDADEDPYPSTATKCSTDSECPKGQQCGYSLFDFATRVDDKGLYALDASIDDNTITNRKRRGACAGNATKACTNGGPLDPPRCTGNGRCRGYSLVAGDTID